MSRLASLAAMATLLVSGAAPAQPFISGATGNLAARLLAAQNRERALVGAPPLQWDLTLADHAASYGPTLASLGTLVHSPREGRPGERENLVMAWHGTMTAEQLVGLWSREKLLLEPGSSGPNCPQQFGCVASPRRARPGAGKILPIIRRWFGQRRPASAARFTRRIGTIWFVVIRRLAISTGSPSSPLRRLPAAEAPASCRRPTSADWRAACGRVSFPLANLRGRSGPC